ncbi:hypothetical protein IDJ77_25020 [Mucilaginibacter sp. ZT4R22]|uniref:Uncharacterized protein n=1 Tax=Mucilaginibacter pankratovii TaxID=2772110 RepID=A0ABR7X0P1_9SPHI|nr:hypothetical protein [Mucilaginibacter pankratovii]MBD1367097.1 hypothetical protein [Mucilaginibacter pankratovii]
MAHYLTIALHLFVVAMMAAFIIGCITALIGTYDHWGNRYVLKARRSRLIRERARKTQTDDSNVRNITPYRARKVNKHAVIHVARFAA